MRLDPQTEVISIQTFAMDGISQMMKHYLILCHRMQTFENSFLRITSYDKREAFLYQENSSYTPFFSVHCHPRNICKHNNSVYQPKIYVYIYIFKYVLFLTIVLIHTSHCPLCTLMLLVPKRVVIIQATNC